MKSKMNKHRYRTAIAPGQFSNLIFCKNLLENDVLVGCRDIDVKEVNLDLWFEDREIQEFIEKLEKKSNKNTSKSNLQNQQIRNNKFRECIILFI